MSGPPAGIAEVSQGQQLVTQEEKRQDGGRAQDQLAGQAAGGCRLPRHGGAPHHSTQVGQSVHTDKNIKQKIVNIEEYTHCSAKNSFY